MSNQIRVGVPPILNADECDGFHAAFTVIAQRWAALILVALATGATRFTQVKHAATGISGRVLAQRLRELEQEGLVARTLVATMPAHAEYSLTERGQALVVALNPLARWGSVYGARG